MKRWRLLMSICLIFLQQAFLEPTHTKLELTSTAEKGTMILSFKVVLNPDMKLNEEAPWKLTITDGAALGLGTPTEPYETKKLDVKLPGFRVATGPLPITAKSGKFSYQLRSFVCSADKSTCYPEVHKGTYSWKIDSK